MPGPLGWLDVWYALGLVKDIVACQARRSLEQHLVALLRHGGEGLQALRGLRRTRRANHPHLRQDCVAPKDDVALAGL